ncbi:MAG: hypothetical protein M1827_003663 [Pycnora praestabilis]|nr:MAG: hypothetical protein M1827_003663 [Pycnora praestabilis]
MANSQRNLRGEALNDVNIDPILFGATVTGDEPTMIMHQSEHVAPNDPSFVPAAVPNYQHENGTAESLARLQGPSGEAAVPDNDLDQLFIPRGVTIKHMSSSFPRYHVAAQQPLWPVQQALSASHPWYPYHRTKRSRRKGEDIDKIYICGWQGCSKSYGAIHHLNTHVSDNSHGVKRVSEDFKEARKAWNVRRKAIEAQKKAQHERARERA